MIIQHGRFCNIGIIHCIIPSIYHELMEEKSFKYYNSKYANEIMKPLMINTKMNLRMNRNRIQGRIEYVFNAVVT